MKTLIIIIALLFLFKILEQICKVYIPKIKGAEGEKIVTFLLSKLSKKDYRIINDIILKTSTATTQIDHIVVSKYGIFVIETKNYKGLIFGDEKSEKWTQSIYGNKKKFMNPIRQNYGHIKNIEKLISDIGSFPIISIIAFSGDCKLNINVDSHVIIWGKIIETIEKYKEVVINDDDINRIYDRIISSNIDSEEVKKEHVRNVRNKKTI